MIFKSHPAILGTVVGVVAIGALILASQTGREDAGMDSSRLFTPAPAGEIRTPAPGKSNWVSRLMSGLKLPVGPSIGGKPSASTAGTKAAASGTQSDIAAELAAARQSAADSAGLDGNASQPDNEGRAQAFGGGDSGEGGGGGSTGSPFGGFKGAKSGGSVGGASMGGGGGGGGASGSAGGRDARASGAAATSPVGKGAGAAAKGPGARPMKAVGVPTAAVTSGGPRAAQQANLGPGTGSALASSTPGGGGGPKYSSGGAGATPSASAPTGGGGVASSDGGSGPAGGGGGPSPQSGGGGGGDGPSNQSSGYGGPDDQSGGAPQLDSQTAKFEKAVQNFEKSPTLVDGRGYAICLTKAYAKRYSDAGKSGLAMSKAVDETKGWFKARADGKGNAAAAVLDDYQEQHILSHKGSAWVQDHSDPTKDESFQLVPDDGLVMTLFRQSEKLRRASVCMGQAASTPDEGSQCYNNAATPISSKQNLIDNVTDGLGEVKTAADATKAAAKNAGLKCGWVCSGLSCVKVNPDACDKVDGLADSLNKGLDKANKAITHVEWSNGSDIRQLAATYEFDDRDAFQAIKAVKREKLPPTQVGEWDRANISARLALTIARSSWTSLTADSLGDDERMTLFFDALRATQSAADTLAWCAAALGARSMGPENTPPASNYVAGEVKKEEECLPEACDCGREGDAPPPAACKGGCDDKK